MVGSVRGAALELGAGVRAQDARAAGLAQLVVHHGWLCPRSVSVGKVAVHASASENRGGREQRRV